jgi:hypothetical protein
MPCRQEARPASLLARNARPCVTAARLVQASTTVVTYAGIGTVRTCAALPIRSVSGVHYPAARAAGEHPKVVREMLGTVNDELDLDGHRRPWSRI